MTYPFASIRFCLTNVAELVVALENDLLAVPAVACQLFAYARNHVVEPADVGVDVEIQFGGQQGWIGRRRGQRLAEARGAFLNDACNVVLHVTPESFPTIVSTAQSGEVVEVGLARGESFELVAIVELALVARAVNEPDILALAAVEAGVGAVLRKEPLREATHRCDSRAGCDQDGVGDGLPQHEMAMRSVHLDCPAGRNVSEIGEMVREETFGDPVHAEIEPVGDCGRRDGVGARLLLSSWVIGYRRDELA